MRIDLNTPVTLTSATETAITFWRWWIGQLRDLLPDTLRQRLAGARWSLRIGDPAWLLRSDAETEDGIALDSAAPASVVKDLIERLEPGARSRRISVQIPASDVLVRHVRIPASAIAHMRSVTRLQLDRLSPFASEAVQFDCRPTGVVGPDDIELEVGIVPKVTLSRYEERLSSIGLVPRRFEVANSELSFRPVHKSLSFDERTQFLLAGAALAIWMIVWLLAPALRDSELGNLSADVDALRRPALSAATARNEVERLGRPLVAASERAAQPNALDVLESLTELIPTNARITNLLIDGTSVRFAGVANDPNMVASTLKRSKQFTAVRLITSSAQGSDKRYFELAAAVRLPRARQR